MMTKEDIDLMIKAITNLDTYLTDDHRVEMENDMRDDGRPDFYEKLSLLRAKLEALQ